MFEVKPLLVVVLSIVELTLMHGTSIYPAVSTATTIPSSYVWLRIGAIKFSGASDEIGALFRCDIWGSSVGFYNQVLYDCNGNSESSRMMNSGCARGGA